jgi:hypothetical protein
MESHRVDPDGGNDDGTGLTEGTAWRTLARAGKHVFKPGDQLLLRRGGVWNEGMSLRGRAPAGNPITLGAYGKGPRPRINGGETHAITAREPVAGWRITGLELTSTNGRNPTHKITGGTCGVFLGQEEPSDYLTIDDCLIHDTSGPGIHLIPSGKPRPVFKNVSIENCEIFNASAGIQFHSPPVYSTEFITNFRIAHVTVHDIGGDGIAPFCSRDGVIEHCKAYRTGLKCDENDHSPVAIWYAWAKRCVIQFCEAWDNHTGGRGADGGGFDLDGGCTECVMQYNYSHDNDGAGFLICSWDPEQWPCTDCVTRFNLSVNDGLANDYASIVFWQSDRCQTYNNTCITRISSPLKFTSDTRDHLIANNIFLVDSDRDIPVVKSAFAIGKNRFRNNLYHRSEGGLEFAVQDAKPSSLLELAKLSQGKGEIAGDPLFFNPAAGDYRLLAGSPARKTGLKLEGMGQFDLKGRRITERSGIDIGALAMRDDE